MFKPSLTIRRQLLIDRQVQFALLQRIALYVSSCALYFLVVLYYAESAHINDESFSRAVLRCVDVVVCWSPGIVLLIPIIAYDLLTFTNRFSGPMFRLRREMQLLIRGESERPITLRNGDLWTEFADLFNELREELMTLRKTPSTGRSQLFGATSSEPTASDQVNDDVDPLSADQPSDSEADDSRAKGTPAIAVDDQRATAESAG